LNFRAAGDGAVIGVLQMLLFERSDLGAAGATVGAAMSSAVMLVMTILPLRRIFDGASCCRSSA